MKLVQVTAPHFCAGIVLDDSWTVVPWQPEFCNWAFNLPRDSSQLGARWDAIPYDLDVLVTHGPPAGIGDRTNEGDDAGCEMLLDAIVSAKPRLHVFGHIHEGYGVYTFGEGNLCRSTTFVNASVCTRKYEPTNSPIVVDL